MHMWNFQGIFQCYTCILEKRISFFVSQEGEKHQPRNNLLAFHNDTI